MSLETCGQCSLLSMINSVLFFLLVEILTSTYAFLNGRGGGQSEHERGREGGKDGPFNQHTHALACLHYGYGCEPRH